MRNLTLTRHEATAAPGVRAACWRQDHLVTACCSDDHIKINIAGKQISAIPRAQLTGNDDRVLSIHHNAYDDRLCLFMRGGDIVEVDLKQDGGFEVVGTVDEEIEAVSWAYEGDVVAITTRTTLSILTRRFDPVAEVKYKASDIKASANQVSVGWGRSDTQFRGKHAKGHAPRDPTLPEKIDAGTLSSEDDGGMRLSWRGDGQYVSVSAIEGERRVIRVYSREGVLESTSEPIDGHEGVLSWRPWGNIIATTKRADEKLECIFFEKNGLRHGEFELGKGARVVELGWNCDSSCLAVQTESSIDFWVASNYKYALKSRIRVSAGARLQWHAQLPLQMLVTDPSGGEVVWINYKWQVLTHQPVGSDDFGLVARIDGPELGLTPLRIANVPPPVSLRTLLLSEEDEVPRHVSISSSCRLICVLFETSIAVYSWDLNSRPVRAPTLEWKAELELGSGQPLQCAINNQRDIRVILSDSSILHLAEGKQARRVTCPEALSAITTFGSAFFLHTRAGRVLTDELAEAATLQQPCTNFAVTEISEQTACFGLADDGTLYAQEHPLTTGITSFLLVDRFLMYTTMSHVKFVHLSSDLQLPAEGVNDERTRQIDRGSQLICSCPSNRSVILQAPRGNLETIYPRLLVLSGIRQAVRARDWAAAWRDAKVHRIDSNILYDLDPQLLLGDIRAFVAALKTSTELDLFLSTLREDDVTKTMYVDTLLADGVPSTHKPSPDKVNTICDTVLASLTNHFRDSHLTSILTAHLCKTPKDYDAALHIVTALTDAEEKDDAITHMCFIADVNELYNQSLGIYDLKLALLFAQKSSNKDPREYVPFLQSIQKLPRLRARYTLNHHLKRHDRALISLLEMRGGEEESDTLWPESLSYTQKHNLWQVALQQVRYSEDWLMRLLPHYGDYLVASNEQTNAARVFEMCGQLDRACESYRSAGRWHEALYTARLSAEIDDAGVASLAEELIGMLDETSRFGEAARLCRDSPVSDVDRAVDYFCRAYDYTEALSLISIAATATGAVAEVQRKIDALIRPRLREHMASQRELLTEMRSQLDAQLPRLREVRQKRREDPVAFFDGTLSGGGGGHAGLDDSPSGAIRDDVSLAGGSEASTTVSLFTRYTGISRVTGATPSMAGSQIRGAAGAGGAGGSSKKTKANTIRYNRRLERQRAKGKKGTVWEEEYLINSISRLCARLDETRDEIRQVVVAGFRLDRPLTSSANFTAADSHDPVSALTNGIADASLSTTIDGPTTAAVSTGNLRRESAALQKLATEIYARARSACDEVYEGVAEELPEEMRANIGKDPLLKPFDAVLEVF